MEWRSSRWFVRIYNGKSAKVELSACGFDVTGCESAIRLIDETMSEMAIFHQLTFCHQRADRMALFSWIRGSSNLTTAGTQNRMPQRRWCPDPVMTLCWNLI
jgi:hypothetical protein